MFCFILKKEALVQSVGGSLSRLGLKSVDMVQFFWSDYNVGKYVATAQYLAEEQAKGRIRHLAVTNFDVPRMQQMMDGGVKFAASQVRLIDFSSHAVLLLLKIK